MIDRSSKNSYSYALLPVTTSQDFSASGYGLKCSCSLSVMIEKRAHFSAEFVVKSFPKIILRLLFKEDTK